MDIFGIGGWELIAILLIVIIVAGPKRMLTWSYQLGRYIAILRSMWVETARQLQKEFDSAGVDVKVPEELPTRQHIQKEIGRLAAPVTQPLEDTMQNLKVTSADIRRPLTAPKPAETPVPPPANTASNGDFGTWSKPDDDK
jgi:Sec-independent protein translocase protein TatA